MVGEGVSNAEADRCDTWPSSINKRSLPGQNLQEAQGPQHMRVDTCPGSGGLETHPVRAPANVVCVITYVPTQIYLAK